MLIFESIFLVSKITEQSSELICDVNLHNEQLHSYSKISKLLLHVKMAYTSFHSLHVTGHLHNK